MPLITCPIVYPEIPVTIQLDMHPDEEAWLNELAQNRTDAKDWGYV